MTVHCTAKREYSNKHRPAGPEEFLPYYKHNPPISICLRFRGPYAYFIHKNLTCNYRHHGF